MSDAPALILKRPRAPRALISLVAMIDVLLILLVFFMVTSTYLDLNMIPAVAQQDGTAGSNSTTPSQPLLIRIGADGAPTVRGQALSLEELSALLTTRLGTAPTLPVLLLPTGVARTQSLVSVMDVATRAGVRNLRVIRLEAQP